MQKESLQARVKVLCRYKQPADMQYNLVAQCLPVTKVQQLSTIHHPVGSTAAQIAWPSRLLCCCYHSKTSPQHSPAHLCRDTPPPFGLLTLSAAHQQGHRETACHLDASAAAALAAAAMLVMRHMTALFGDQRVLWVLLLQGLGHGHLWVCLLK